MIRFKAVRSLLFVPAHRESWVGRTPQYDADAIILDLEDSVPAEQKGEAREVLRNWIPRLSEKGVRVFVRINRWPDGYDAADIEACVPRGCEGIVLPKVFGPEDVEAVSRLLDALEPKHRDRDRPVLLIPTLETARGLHFAYECALPERVTAVFGAVARNADVSRSVGFQWTEEGLETLYLRSRVVLAVRAAGKLPLGGLWQKVHELDGLRASAQANRRLGMTGEMILHPSNAAIVNEVYSPSADDVRYFEGMVEAYERAVASGRASVMYDGEHIDAAHVQTARGVLALARSSKE